MEQGSDKKYLFYCYQRGSDDTFIVLLDRNCTLDDLKQKLSEHDAFQFNRTDRIYYQFVNNDKSPEIETDSVFQHLKNTNEKLTVCFYARSKLAVKLDDVVTYFSYPMHVFPFIMGGACILMLPLKLAVVMFIFSWSTICAMILFVKKHKYHTELNKLRELEFYNYSKNIELLKKHNGNVDQVVKELIKDV